MSNRSSNLVKSPQITGHVYDGIEEYDNPTPGWWTWIFAGSIAFSGVYFLFVMLAGGQLSPLGFYDRDLTADAQRQFAQLGERRDCLKPGNPANHRAFFADLGNAR